MTVGAGCMPARNVYNQPCTLCQIRACDAFPTHSDRVLIYNFEIYIE